MLRLFDRGHGGKAHDEVTDAVAAVDEGGSRALLHDADNRTRRDPARLQAPQVKRQADHAVGIAAAQIGLDHQPGDDVRIFGGKPGGLEGTRDEDCELRCRNTRHFARACDGGVGRDLP